MGKQASSDPRGTIVPEPERLQPGRTKRRDRRAASAGTKAEKTGTFRERWKKRRRAKKKRIAAMSRKRRYARRAGIISTWFLGAVAAMMVTAMILFYTLSDVPRPADLPLPQVATILYSNGNVMARIGTVNRTIVQLDEVPKQVQWDVLAAEDRNFYNDPGVSITGTIRAALNDVTGGDTQGGSGITQQYAKNAYLSNARTLSRKLKELAIAVKLSRDYTKDQILEFYLNTVYFGRGAYGIQAASQVFFGKDVSQLDVSEGAVLAAMLRAPSYYDPANNPGEAQGRWKYVLDGMVSTGHLTQAQEDALAFPKVIAPKKSNGLSISGPKALIVQRVIAELEANNISEDEIYARGLTIQTTINQKAQQAAESAVNQTFSNLTKQQRNMKNALVAVAPASGAVLAYYGGPNGDNYAGQKDYYDYASLGFAAPGSSFKPYTLATALQQTLDKKAKIAIDTRVDGSYCVTIESTKICNDPSDQQFSSSSIKVSDAMKYSLNTTFDQMAQKVGPSNVADTAHAAGISKLINGKPSLTNASGQTTFGIGIGDFPVHPIDQAVGFATFANDGKENSAFFVKKATASDGTLVYRHQGKPKQAIDSKVANDVTMTLEPIAAWSGVALANGRPSAAKTGTEGIQTGKHKGGNSDAWMVGFTPQVSAAVWVGSGDSTTPIYDSTGSAEYGRDLPGKTWKIFMDTWLNGKDALPLPNKQMIKTSTSSPSTTASRAPTHSNTPTPTFSPSSGPSSRTSTPTPTTSTRKPPPSASPTSCAPGLLAPDCTTPTPTPPPSGSAPASP
jgi:membrane peptidoglycan carboxypeptidase